MLLDCGILTHHVSFGGLNGLVFWYNLICHPYSFDGGSLVVKQIILEDKTNPVFFTVMAMNHDLHYLLIELMGFGPGEIHIVNN
jgi:hypothetical protein